MQEESKIVCIISLALGLLADFISLRVTLKFNSNQLPPEKGYAWVFLSEETLWEQSLFFWNKEYLPKTIYVAQNIPN